MIFLCQLSLHFPFLKNELTFGTCKGSEIKEFYYIIFSSIFDLLQYIMPGVILLTQNKSAENV